MLFTSRSLQTSSHILRHMRDASSYILAMLVELLQLYSWMLFDLIICEFVYRFIKKKILYRFTLLLAFSSLCICYLSLWVRKWPPLEPKRDCAGGFVFHASHKHSIYGGHGFLVSAFPLEHWDHGLLGDKKTLAIFQAY